MIYEIAGLRIKIDNRFSFTTELCKDWLSEDQVSAYDLQASAGAQAVQQERLASEYEYSDAYLENICIYRDICFKIPALGRILLHGGILSYENNAYAFLGRSGTGKSTHMRLWKRFVPGAEILNGDKPILRAANETILAYGTPWKGKEGFGEHKAAPLRALCFLEQAKENSIRRLSQSEAAERIFSQLLIPPDEENVVATMDFADKLVSTLPCCLLKCDISEEAVKTSFEGMLGEKYINKKEKMI